MQRAEPSARSVDLRLAPRSQLSLLKEQLRRSPYALLFVDAVIAWLLIVNGASQWIVVWCVLSTAVQFARAYAVRRIHLVDAALLRSELRALNLWFFLAGLTRVWPIAVAFGGEAPRADYLITIVMVGLAAGGVGTAAGMVRPYLWWMAPLALALVWGWIAQGTFEGRWIAALLLLMFALLAVNVRNFGRTLDQLREQIRRANDERQRAEIAVLAKARFFAAASHDLRQPLGVLRWYGDAVCAYAEQLNHEPLRAVGEGIGRALAHAEPLVGKYLDIAKIEAGAIELSLGPVQVAQLFEEVRQAFSHEAEAASLSLRLCFEHPCDRLVVHTDASVLRSILDNLVGNAIKFTPSGEVTLRAGLVEAASGRLVRIEVDDTGIGIPLDEHEHVFEDFYQLGNPDRNRSRGLGLGLAIVRRQAALLGTAVHLTSEPGSGSRFEFDLPQAAQVDTEDVLSSVGSAGPTTMPGLRLMVVDDEPEVRNALRVVLELMDWEVRTAAGLFDVLAELQRGYRPDGLVVDFRLRGQQTGGEIVEELRRSGFDLPAVIVTGDTSQEQLAALHATGLPVLHKPVRRAQLVAAIVDAVGRRRLK